MDTNDNDTTEPILCKRCGALMLGGEWAAQSRLLHAAWHGLLERRIELAGRYKPPPTYR